MDKQREEFEKYYIENLHDGDIHTNQQLLEWSEKGEFYFASSVDELWDFWQQAQKVAVPEGFVVVPREPSAELVNHGHQMFLGHFNEGGQTGGRSLYYAYKSMIEAQES